MVDNWHEMKTHNLYQKDTPYRPEFDDDPMNIGVWHIKYKFK